MTNQLPTDVAPGAVTEQAATPTQPGQGAQVDLRSTKDLRQDGEQLTFEQLMARYDGLVGASRQYKSVMDGARLEIEQLQSQYAQAQQQLVDAQQKLGGLDALNAELATTKTGLQKAQAQVDKQGVLMKFPRLLAGEGRALADLAMAADMPLDKLEEALTKIATGFGVPTMPATPAGAPPSPTSDDPDALGAQAQEAYQKWKATGYADDALKAQYDNLTALVRKAKAAKKL